MNKYSRVASDLRRKIEDGHYSAGEKLPTIPELCEEYCISKITVKHAMDELERLGLIARRRGSGTYVKGGTHNMRGVATSSVLSSMLGGFTAEHETVGERTGVILHDFGIGRPDANTSKLLGIDSEAYCYFIRRTLTANDAPLQDQEVVIPLSVIPNLLPRHAMGSLYQYFEEQLGLKIDSAHRRVSATHPSHETARHLGIGENVPVLKVVQLSFLDDGRACELSTSIHAPGYNFLTICTQ